MPKTIIEAVGTETISRGQVAGWLVISAFGVHDNSQPHPRFPETFFVFGNVDPRGTYCVQKNTLKATIEENPFVFISSF